VLLCWTEGQPTLSLSEVAERTGLTTPTAHRMIRALQREGFLVQDAVSGRYALGPTVMDLARVLLQRADQDELVVVAMPHLERLRQATGETVGLHLPMGTSRVCVAELVSQEPIRTAAGVGRTYVLPRGAAGKVLVAWSDEHQAILRQENLITAAEHARLAPELAEIRARQWAMSEGETIAGASALAVPIFGPNGDVRAAINVTGPAGRWTREARLKQVPVLLEEARQISAQLGHRTSGEPPKTRVSRRASTVDNGARGRRPGRGG
jgi:DNA-binding IclR family transcriptional regulator